MLALIKKILSFNFPAKIRLLADRLFCTAFCQKTRARARVVTLTATVAATQVKPLAMAAVTRMAKAAQAAVAIPMVRLLQALASLAAPLASARHPREVAMATEAADRADIEASN